MAVDTAPPQLRSFEMTPQNLDVRYGSIDVTVTMRITDNDTGAQAPYFNFASDTTSQSRGFGVVPRVSGNSLDGIYKKTFRFDPGVAGGNWRAVLYPLTDTRGNSGSFSEPGTLTVVSESTVENLNPADYDSTFGDGGVVMHNLDLGFPEAWGAVVDSEGRAVSLGIQRGSDGSGGQMAVARYLSNGEPDPAFGGGDGHAEVQAGEGATPYSVGLIGLAQPGSGIIVGGGASQATASGPLQRPAVVRLAANGTVDTTFGTNGRVSLYPGAGTEGQVLDLESDANGGILVLSYVWEDQAPTLYLSRLSADGALDATFGENGYLNLADSAAGSIRRQPNGQIVVGFARWHNSDSGASPPELGFVVERLEPDGSLDLSFGEGGSAFVPLRAATSPNDHISMGSVALQSDGGILISGVSVHPEALDSWSGQQLTVARLVSDGTPDPEFGRQGVAFLPPSMEGPPGGGQGLAVDETGGIVVSGWVGNGSALVGRLDPHGVPDPGFGAGGIAVRRIGARDVIAQPDGRLLLGGGGIAEGGRQSSGGLARLVGGHAPETDIIVGPGSLVNSNDVRFEFSSQNSSILECQLDSAAWSTCASPKQIGGLLDGDHTFAVRAVGANGLRDRTPARHSFTVDTTAPVVSISDPAQNSDLSDPTPDVRGTGGAMTGDASGITLSISQPGGAPLVMSPSVAEDGSWTQTVPHLTDGVYTLIATQSDSAGNTGTATTRRFRVDTVNPAVSLDAIPDTKDSTPELTGSAAGATGTGIPSADAPTVTVRIYSGNAAMGAPEQTFSGPRTLNTWTGSSPTLAPGIYTAQATQTDAAGNTGTSPARTFKVDLAAPSVSITAPAENLHTKDTTPAISGTAGAQDGTAPAQTADSAIVTVRLYDNATGSGTPIRTLTPTRTGTAWTVDVPVVLADGAYTVRASQEDAVGNLGESTAIGFRVDTTGPAVTVTAPVNSSATNNVTPTISGGAGFAVGDLAPVTVEILNSTNVVIRSATVQAVNGTWSATVAPALTQGTYIARARQSDAAGNETLTSTRTFTVDTTNPILSVTAPMANAAGSDRTPTFSGTGGTASGDNPSVSVQVFNGQTVTGTALIDTTATVTSGAWAFSVPAVDDLADGTYTARFGQTDAAGNLESILRTFKVDATAPAVAVVAPAGGSATNDTTPTVSGTAGSALVTADSVADNVEITVELFAGLAGTGTVVRTHTTDAVSGAWTVDVSPALAEGVYSIRVTQSDAAGNAGESTLATFKVDTTAPAVAVTAPAVGSETTDTTPTVSGTAGGAADDASTVIVNVFAGIAASGSPAQILTAPRSGTNWTIDTSVLPVGDWTVVASQADAAGNFGTSAAQTFKVKAAPGSAPTPVPTPVPSATPGPGGGSGPDATPGPGGGSGPGIPPEVMLGVLTSARKAWTALITNAGLVTEIELQEPAVVTSEVLLSAKDAEKLRIRGKLVPRRITARTMKFMIVGTADQELFAGKSKVKIKIARKYVSKIKRARKGLVLFVQFTTMDADGDKKVITKRFTKH
jgi:uncharacterized delta-60 repeat protein